MSAHASSEARPAAEDAQLTRRSRLVSLSLGIVLGPIAALTQQEAIYAVNMWACGHDQHAVMHIIPALSMIVVFGAGIAAYRNWTAVGRGLEDEEGSAATRTRFLALLGISISVFCALVIIAQWFAIFVFGPCHRA